MSNIRPDELDDRLDADDAPYVLDIRPRKAFQSGHIDGSRNIPVYDDLRGGDEDALRSRLDKIPQDSPVVTVCKMGVVAKRATAILDEEGYEVSTLAGGMSGWRGYRAGSLGYRVRSVLWRLF